MADGAAAIVLAFLILLVLAWAIRSNSRRRTAGSYTYHPRATSYPSRHRVPWDGTWAFAEYEGQCPRCHRSIRVGDEITWWDHDGETQWIHVRCR